jgi:hypothetical protein
VVPTVESLHTRGLAPPPTFVHAARFVKGPACTVPRANVTALLLEGESPV